MTTLRSLVEDIVTIHEDFQARATVAPASVKLRATVLRRLEREVGPLDTVSTTGLEDWLNGLAVSASSRATYLVQLRGFYRWALRSGIVDHDPTADVDLPRAPRRVPRPLEQRACAHRAR